MDRASLSATAAAGAARAPCMKQATGRRVIRDAFILGVVKIME
jgi:hypothetical protein